MNHERLILLLALIGVLSVCLLTFHPTTKGNGTIKSLEESSGRIRITLEESLTPLIIFSEESLPVQKGDYISFEGTPEKYQGQEQIVIRKISKEH